MNTSVREFERWLELVPEDFDLRLIPVRRGMKSPCVPKSRSWKEEEFRLSETEARKRLNQGRNVGFVARENLVVLDIDDEQEARELLDGSLFDTLTVDTRSGGTHLYFVNGGIENSDVPDTLEVRASWRYVLVPGSYVDPGNTEGNGLYKVRNKKNPSMIFPDEIPDELKATEEEASKFEPISSVPNEPYENRHGWRLEDIRKLDPKLDRLLRDLEPSGYRYPSISEADMATAEKLLYWEFDASTSAEIIRQFRRRKKVLERPDYLKLTLSKADSRIRERISDHVDPESWTPESIEERIEIGEEDP